MATSSNRYRPQCIDPRLVARDQVFIAVVSGGSECNASTDLLGRYLRT
jgi:hypothetical protein